MNNRNTIVYVKVNGARPTQFQDPVPFEWTSDKEKQLWSIVSKLDNYQDQIDWAELSRTLGAPEYFLKRRSYKLSANHLKLLEQQIERKMKGRSEDQEANMRQYEPILQYPLSNGDSAYSAGAKEEKSQLTVDAEDTTIRALRNMQTSKLLTRYKGTSGADKDGKKANEGNNSDSDASSSLSISNSALEEALMDRLQL